ncbi:MAG: trigger factor, partial [Lachnospiraceae bacterium]|nr:trigger factor [Lachnospiraceae bacterium]
RNAKEDAVIDAIIEDAAMDIPEAMVDTTKRQMIEEFAQRIQSQGISFDQYMQFTGMTADKLLEQVTPQAERRIKSRLVLEAVAKAENLTATEEDFEAEVKEMAENYKMEAADIKTNLGEEGRKQLMEEIAVKKAVDFVVDNAKEK